MAPILEVTDVTKTYGTGHTAVTAVNHAAFSVEEGQFVVSQRRIETLATVPVGSHVLSHRDQFRDDLGGRQLRVRVALHQLSQPFREGPLPHQ